MYKNGIVDVMVHSAIHNVIILLSSNRVRKHDVKFKHRTLIQITSDLNLLYQIILYISCAILLQCNNRVTYLMWT